MSRHTLRIVRYRLGPTFRHRRSTYLALANAVAAVPGRVAARTPTALLLRAE
jgi:hypothetical protein